MDYSATLLSILGGRTPKQIILCNSDVTAKYYSGYIDLAPNVSAYASNITSTGFVLNATLYTQYLKSEYTSASTLNLTTSTKYGGSALFELLIIA